MEADGFLAWALGGCALSQQETQCQNARPGRLCKQRLGSRQGVCASAQDPRKQREMGLRQISLRFSLVTYQAKLTGQD